MSQKGFILKKDTYVLPVYPWKKCVGMTDELPERTQLSRTAEFEPLTDQTPHTQLLTDLDLIFI